MADEETKVVPPRVHKYLAEDLSFRASVLVGTRVVQEMQSLQNTFPLATNAVGRCLIGSLLMASQLKDSQMVSLYFKGDGPLEMFFAEATFEGAARGYTPNPQIELPEPHHPLDLGFGIGAGTLTVVRSLPKTQLQLGSSRGSVSIVSGEVAEDLAHYYQQSHQIPSLIALGVKVNEYGMVLGAGGFLLEMLPGAKSSEDVIPLIEKNFAAMAPLSEQIAGGATESDLSKALFKGVPVTELDHPFSVKYECRCTKERLVRALSLLGESELEKMIEDGESAKANCELCGQEYAIQPAELSELVSELRSSRAH